MKHIFFITVAAFTLISCSTKETKQTETSAAPMSMPMSFETVSIQKSNPQVNLKLPGEIVADQEVSVYAKVNSYVKTLRVDIGSTVQRGQVIMVLEAPEIQAQIATARSRWNAQVAIYTATKASYDRLIEASKTEGAVSNDAIDQLRAKKLSDEAQVGAARSAYNELKAMEDYLVIRAPFSGVVTDRNVELGSYVGTNGKGSDRPLLVIQTNNKLRLALSVPEANTPYIHNGDTIRFTVSSLPGRKFLGRVSRKSGALDSRLRSERIEVDVINNTNELKPLMVAEAILPLQSKTPTFFIPKPAVVESNLGTYVMKIVNGKTKKVAIVKGRTMPETVEVFGELQEGDAIVKKASEEMTEGIDVSKKTGKGMASANKSVSMK